MNVSKKIDIVESCIRGLIYIARALHTETLYEYEMLNK